MNAPPARHPRHNNAYYIHGGNAEEPGAVLDDVVATWSYAARVNALERLETLVLIQNDRKMVRFLSVRRSVKDTELRLEALIRMASTMALKSRVHWLRERQLAGDATTHIQQRLGV